MLHPGEVPGKILPQPSPQGLWRGLASAGAFISPECARENRRPHSGQTPAALGTNAGRMLRIPGICGEVRQFEIFEHAGGVRATGLEQSRTLHAVPTE